jgi:hypothetical protein
MTTICCKLANSLTFSPNAEGVKSISISPSTSLQENIGTIRISGYCFDGNTGPYLDITCGPFSAESSINWVIKKKCGTWSGGNISIPGDDNSLLFIPQISSPTVIKTPEDFGNASEGSHLSFINKNPVKLDGYDSLGGPVDALEADGSSGPQARVSSLNAYFFKRVKFTGINEIYNFNTNDSSNNDGLDMPVTLVIDGNTYNAYPQTFSLAIDPPSPAQVAITYIYEDTGLKPISIDNCGV